MKKALTLICLTILYCSTTVFAQKQITKLPVAKVASYEQIKEKTLGVKAEVSEKYKTGFESSVEFRKKFEPDGPYSYINPDAEILDKRDLTTKHFKCNDGTITAVASAGPVHYQKNGVWNSILNDVYPSSQFPGFGYANTYNRFQTYYGNSLQNGIRVVTENSEQLELMQDAGVYFFDASMKQTGSAGAIAGTIKVVQDEYLTYENLFPGVNASVEHNGAGYELSYELNNLNWLNVPANTAYVSFREGVKVPVGYHAYLEKENTIVVIKNNDGRVLLKYKAPHFFEKTKTTENGETNGRYFTEEKNGVIYVNVLVDAEWLTDASRKFPLIIDPVVTVTPQAAFAWTFTVEEDGGCDFGTNNDADENLRVGYDDGFFDDDYYQCYAKYDISSIPDNACFVNYSYCRWYQYNFTNDASGDDNLQFWYQAYDPITTDPVVQTCDQNYADINGTGTVYRFYNAFGNYLPVNTWQPFEFLNVASRVQAALPYDFVTFSLDNANQGGHSDPAGPSNDEWLDFRGYASGNRPQLIINYETPYVAASSITVSPAATICPGTSVSLTRFGGTTGSNGNWGWYAGSTFLQYNNTSITVTPASTTTYCVRGENACGNTTCTPVTITVQSISVAPTSVSGTSTICTGGSTTLTRVGGSLGAGAQWFWYSGSCGGVFVGNGNSITVSPGTTTTYFVRAEGTCNTTTCASVTVTVNTPSTAPGSVSVSSSTICNGQSTLLTANGGSLGTGGVYRWYSGSCGGTLVGTGVSITPSPTVTTTYYVRAEDPSPCNTLTTCASTTITVNQPSVAPTGISGITTICNGVSTTLSVVGGSLGTGASWNWYSGGCGGTFVGSGPSVTVSPASSTTYFVRAEGPSPCPTTTACVSQLVTVNTLSTSPVSVSGVTTICEGLSTTLTVVGGSLGTGGSWVWYAGGCGSGASVGTGATVTLTPSTSTNYYVRAEGTCNTTTCAFTAVTVNDSSVVASSISGSAAVCIGSSTNLTAVGGHLGIGASWNWYSSSCGGTPEGTGSTIPVSPVVNTTYYLRAQGLCNTTVCIPFTVSVNPLPNGSISGSVTVCSGVDTAVTFNFAVGTGPFTVVYTDGTNTFTKSNVSAGDTIRVLPATTTTYTIQQITDANGCIRNTGFLGAATVTVAPLPVVNNVFVQDVLCNGGNTGAFTVTATNGTPSYTYSNDNGGTYQGSNFFAGLIAGTYQVFIQDALACISTPAYPVVVGEPTVLTHTTVPQNASCDNVFDGSITVNATGGVVPYTYSLNGGPTQPGNVFNGLADGNYSILVTDDNGCTSSSSVFIDTAYAVYASLVSQTPVSCFGGVDGTVTVQLTGGVPPYSYSINGVQFVPTSTFTGLASGNYVVTLRDSKGCTDFVNVTITQPNQLQAQIDSIFNIGCNGASSGAIYITVSGGNPAYSFLWSNGATSEDITGLVAGTYNVAITDTKGCSASVGATISQPLPLFVSVASYHDLLCYNDSSGSIDITANGGVPPYSFVWSNGETTEDIYGLLPGTYSATVTDANGCQETISQDIIQPTQLTSTVSSTPVLCAGAASGSVDLDVTGGTSPYNYIWNNGATTQDVTSASGGTYTVVVHDANDCSITNSIVVAEPAPITISVVVTDVLCNGGLTGAIDITVNGGTPTITYVWSNSATSEDLTGIAAGNYSVTITDGNGCTASASAIVSQPAGLVLNATPVNVGCNGGANGSVDITVQGGVFPYTFIWSNSATTEDINGLSGGVYSVTVSDANSCTITASFTISEPAAIVSTLTATHVTCFGASNGAIDLTVSGGTAPYSYLWNTFQTVEDLTGISGGTYFVIVTDANGCEKHDSVLVTEAPALVLSVSVTNVLCNGAATGAVDLTVTGGTGLYDYNWSNSTSTQDLINVVAGTYTVTVKDANNCSAVTSATVTQPAAMVMNSSVINVGCAGGADGSVDITVQGGVFPYSYLWSNSSTNEDIYNVSGGSFSVTVTDANACTITASFTIAEPTAITSSVAGTDVTCNGANDGAADLTVSGGTAPYVFLWSTFQGSEDISGLDGGLYYVIITDANGCESKDSVLLAEPDPLMLTTVVTNISCFNANDGAVDLTVTGGTPNYLYAWSNSTTTEDLTALPGGLYVVTVTDDHGCTATTSVTIVNPSAIYTNFIVKNPLCYGDTSGRVDLIVSGGTPLYNFLWSTGAVSEDLINLGAGTYIVTVTDSRNCSQVDSTTVTEPGQIFTSGVVKNVTCAGLGDGFVDITGYAGTLPYSYLWSTGQSTEDIFNQPGGDYYVTVTDANGCQAVSLYIINEPLPLGISIVKTDVTCYGAATGTLAVVPTGGSRPYYYLWNNFVTDSLMAGVAAGHYVVQLTDSNACFIYDSIDVAQPTEINITAVLTDAVCFGAATAIVNVTTTGGTPSYTFNWSNTATIEDLNGVVAGTYTITVTDANTCQKEATFTVGQGTQIISNLGTYDPICHGGNTGSITSITTGGVQPYAYAWSNSKTTISIGNLIAGTYTLTVTDALTCTASATAVINDPASILVTTNAQGAKCFNVANGNVGIGVTGGYAPYTYLLNGSGQSSDSSSINFANLAAGDYLLIVTDVNGCQGTANFSVASPGQIDVDLIVTEQVILTGMNTQLIATATSDTTILNYFWYPDSVIYQMFDYSNCGDPLNCPNPLAAPRTTTTFTVIVMNADSCYASDTVTVEVLNQPSAFIPTAFSPNGDQLNDRFEFDILGAVNIDISVFDRWGQRIYYNASQANGITNQNGWDGKLNGKPAPFDTYVYQMKVTYFDNVTKEFTGTVTIMR